MEVKELSMASRFWAEATKRKGCDFFFDNGKMGMETSTWGGGIGWQLEVMIWNH